MSTLTAAYVELRDDLARASTPAYAIVPEDVQTPCIVLEPPDDYVTGSNTTLTAGEYELKATAWLLVDLITNEQAADDLSVLLEHVLAYLRTSDTWGLDSIGRPAPVTTGAWTAHGLPVNLSRYITLT